MQIVRRVALPHNLARLLPLPRVLQGTAMPTSVFVREPPAGWGWAARALTRAAGVGTVEFSPPDALKIAARADASLRLQMHGLVFLHLPDADIAGHESGWNSPEYDAAARRLDEALGRIARAANVPADPGTLLIALADHGGGGDPRDHVSNTPENVRIPLLFAGAAAPRRLPVGPSLLDVPATVLSALRMDIPSSYAGRSLLRPPSWAKARRFPALTGR